MMTLEQQILNIERRVAILKAERKAARQNFRDDMIALHEERYDLAHKHHLAYTGLFWKIKKRRLLKRWEKFKSLDSFQKAVYTVAMFDLMFRTLLDEIVDVYTYINYLRKLRHQ